MRSLALTTTQQRRLEKLARDAGRTPHAMLRFVLRDGFELCEMEVNESIAAERDATRYGYVPQAEAQRQASNMIGATHARKRRQAA
jgi:NADH:ubiquinone oxidoreductase subunit B-like Fe-S oxidoreductase